jgi:hypothetical protein
MKPAAAKAAGAIDKTEIRRAQGSAVTENRVEQEALGR